MKWNYKNIAVFIGKQLQHKYLVNVTDCLIAKKFRGHVNRKYMFYSRRLYSHNNGKIWPRFVEFSKLPLKMGA